MASSYTNQPIPPLSEFLESSIHSTELFKRYKVPDKYIVKRHGFRFDFVTPSSTRTSTITKAYGGKMVSRGGSLLISKEVNLSAINFNEPERLIELFDIRFLSPVEVARLHCFPIDSSCDLEGAVSGRHGFGFPDNVTLKQRWKLLGNSLNVRVVGELLFRLFNE
jgi:tRNA (cytosine38-C5)-methyltransferase